MARPPSKPKDKSSPSAITARLMTPKDVAQYLNITESQVYTLMREGDLLALKIGKRGVWRVDRDELERYIARLMAEARQRVGGARGRRRATTRAGSRKEE